VNCTGTPQAGWLSCKGYLRPVRLVVVQLLPLCSLGVPMSFTVCQLATEDIGLMKALLDVFGEAFNEIDTYKNNQPKAAYLQQLLGGDSFIAVVGLDNGEVIGGIAAYELKKFEQPRSEIYIYDLAVAENYRRKGVATALISELKKIAAARGAYVIYVQADIGDEPAIALYTKLGVREDVLHFDIAVANSNGVTHQQ
jgi:aminoglycoside 3-N-acetyltransferase I